MQEMIILFRNDYTI